MMSGMDLALGFALFSTMVRRNVQTKKGARGTVHSIWAFSIQLFLVLIFLLAMNMILQVFLWSRIGREDLGILLLFFSAFLVDHLLHPFEGRRERKARLQFFINPSLILLLGFALWILGEEGSIVPDSWRRWLMGLSLPLASGFFQWLLWGLEGKLRLSDIPGRLRGMPILFWLVTILSLTFGWLGRGSW
jgi:hypothetical protein